MLKRAEIIFFSFSEAELIEIFGKFFDYYLGLYFKKGKNIDFFWFNIAKSISLALVCCSFTQPVCFFSLPPSRNIWLRKRYLFARNDIQDRKNRAYLWWKNGYCDSQECLYYLSHSNIPRNTIFDINQAYFCHLAGEKVCVIDLFFIGQISYIQNLTTDNVISCNLVMWQFGVQRYCNNMQYASWCDYYGR